MMYSSVLTGIMSPVGYRKEAAPPMACILAKLISYLAYSYADIIREENPETRRFSADDPYTIAECWAHARGFELCLRTFLKSFPTNEKIAENALAILDHLFIEEGEKKIDTSESTSI